MVPTTEDNNTDVESLEGVAAVEDAVSDGCSTAAAAVVVVETRGRVVNLERDLKVEKVFNIEKRKQEEKRREGRVREGRI